MQGIEYITYNDLYGGIYQSQVIDVINTLNNNFDVNIELKAFVPLKLWKSQAKIIKSHMPEAKVYPILGRVNSVYRTGRLLRAKNNIAICRGPLAYLLAHSKFPKVIYDGRAAVRAEVEEYNVAGSSEIGNLMVNAEKLAVENSTACIAVSNQLVAYWKDVLGITFDCNKVVVIPCTLSEYMTQVDIVSSSENEVKIVYSGGTGPWQSFDKVTQLLSNALDQQGDLRVVFLTKEHDTINSLVSKYPNRVERKWLSHDKVFAELSSCDYGILIRDDTWTNRVASPVKFAEYLNAGLSVLISNYLGDYSDVVISNQLGFVVNDTIPKLNKLTDDQRIENQEYCKLHLLKEADEIVLKYKELLSKVI